MARSELNIVLKLTDKASSGLKSASRSLTGFQKGAALAGGALIAAAGAAVGFAVSSAKLAARVETLGVVTKVLGKNVGYTEREIRKFEQGIVDQGITLRAARQSVARMIQSNIDLTKSTELATMAQNAAVIAGVDSSEAFDRLVMTIQTANVRMGRTMGLALNFGKAYDEAAAAVGKTAEQLTEQEKAQIRTNHVLEQGINIQDAYGAAMETAGKQITSLPRYIEELKVATGDILLPTWTELVFVTKDLVIGLRDLVVEQRNFVRGSERLVQAGLDEEWIFDNLIGVHAGAQVDAILLRKEKEKLIRVMDAEIGRWNGLADAYEVTEGFEEVADITEDIKDSLQPALTLDIDILRGMSALERASSRIAQWSEEQQQKLRLQVHIASTQEAVSAGGTGLMEQHGGTFTVPPGYPNDSFPMRVSSGERVSVQNDERSFFGNSTVNINNGTGMDAFEEILRNIQ